MPPLPGSGPMPALFVGHGSPLNALADNPWTRAWRDLGAAIPRPRAVLCVSAHWYVRDTRVAAAERPRTIHDFGGFPDELYRVEYPAPGDPALARRVRDPLAPVPVALDAEWGLDHGAWSVLAHLFPAADVPVVQLALDRTREPAFHREIGRRLGPLRDEGVLVLGSGNVVHNLARYAWSGGPVAPLDWAARFEAWVKRSLLEGAHDSLVDVSAPGTDAALAVPTPDHYLPLLHVVGLVREGDPIAFPVEGIDGGSVSMLAVRVG